MTKLSLDTFNNIKTKYGEHASWAVWADQTDRPKSNMGDLSIFDEKTILDVLNPNIVLVALNFSVNVKKMRPFENFHGENGEVYKLRFALKDTPLWGSYMTDIIKDFVEADSGKVEEYLEKNPKIVKDNLDSFQEELKELKVKPILVALGVTVKDILNNHLKDKFEIHDITHYGWQRGAEQYRDKVLEKISLIENI